MQDRFEAFTVLIAKISRSIRRIKADEMAEYDLKATHVNCLYYLYSAGGMTAAELCEKCEEDKAAISRSLEYLEANGYVEGERSAGKRYRSRLQLTEKGEKTADCAEDRWNRRMGERGRFSGGSGSDVSRAHGDQRAP